MILLLYNHVRKEEVKGVGWGEGGGKERKSKRKGCVGVGGCCCNVITSR